MGKTPRSHLSNQSAAPVAGKPGRSRPARLILMSVGVSFFLLIIIATVVWQQPAGAPATAAGSVPSKVDRLEVVQFHWTDRCEGCLWMEQHTRETLQAYFSAEMGSGRITFREVDIEKPENANLVNLYGASGSQLFFNWVAGGRDNVVEVSDVYPYIFNDVRFSDTLKAMIESGLSERQ